MPFCPHLSSYVSELFEALTHPVILLKISFVLKPSNLLFVDSRPPPLLKSSKPFHMYSSLPLPHTFLLSPQSFCIFTYPLIEQEVFLPFSLSFITLSSHCFWKLLPLIAFFSYTFYLSLSPWIPPFICFCLSVSISFSVVSPQTPIPFFISLPPNLLSHLHFDSS